MRPFRIFDSVGLHVDRWWLASRWGDVISCTQWRIWRALTAEHALEECGGLDELAGPGEACGFANYVLV
jgi:hypothetical protein